MTKIILALSLILSVGCVIESDPPDEVLSDEEAGLWVPPPPRCELPPVLPPPPRCELPAPRPGYVWVCGRYAIRDCEVVWIDGHWERARA